MEGGTHLEILVSKLYGRLNFNRNFRFVPKPNANGLTVERPQRS